MVRSVATSACTSSFWLVTDTYSPVPIENAPATSAATPVSITVCADTPPPPSPAISDAFVTSPSTAPNTVGRSQPPETSRCRCDQPAPSAALPAGPWGCCFSSRPTRQSPPRQLPGDRHSNPAPATANTYQPAGPPCHAAGRRRARATGRGTGRTRSHLGCSASSDPLADPRVNDLRQLYMLDQAAGLSLCS